MPLSTIVVADPVASLAKQIADGCERLANHCIVVTQSEALLEIEPTNQPDLMILSCELANSDTVSLVEQLKQKLTQTFIIISFRELAIPTMEKLTKLGIEDFIAQPFDLTSIYRAASRHFGTAFRRFERHHIALDVTRADGVVIGRTIDLSEGGLRMHAFHPVTVGDSLLVDLALDEGKPLRVRCRVLEVEGQPPIPVAVRVQFENLRGREHERMIAFTNKLAQQKSSKE
ncbi:MAG: PilZ domain-containing protein [Deltaproteobacteria bacterium]|nr:PilZ domain-containing protein [Deltaproteobacteria bacterium]